MRLGLSVVELLVVVSILAILLALLLPAVFSARESSRRIQCGNNLRQLGISLHAFHAANEAFPPGSETKPSPRNRDFFGSDGVFANGLTLLLPFLESANSLHEYDNEEPWYYQHARVASQHFDLFMCPSNSGKPSPLIDNGAGFVAGTIQSPIGRAFGLTDYVMSKGAINNFCSTPRKTPGRLRGVFDNNLRTSAKDITDGLSKTIAMGEGAGGPTWPLCTNPDCVKPDGPTPIPLLSLHPTTSDPPPYYARQFWIGSGNTTMIFDEFKWMVSSHLSTTVQPLNANPVTHFLLDEQADFTDCTGEQPNRHQVSGFRSDHPGGGNFLLADGAVRFVAEDIKLNVYRAMSSVAGGVDIESGVDR